MMVNVLQKYIVRTEGFLSPAYLLSSRKLEMLSMSGCTSPGKV
jgi:hypothetical protein